MGFDDRLASLEAKVTRLEFHHQMSLEDKRKREESGYEKLIDERLAKVERNIDHILNLIDRA